MQENIAPVRDFYENTYNEEGREARHPLEFIRTREIIARHLGPQPLEAADLCGAAGTYAYWLAGLGHRVHLLDMAQNHIDAARQRGLESGIELAGLTVGDARSLPYPTGQFDLVLLMGALYHLQQQNDRLQCLAEVRRVLKPGGLAVFSYISRYASLVDGLSLGTVSDPAFADIMRQDLATGLHQNPTGRAQYFTTAYFHTPDIIREELALAGFTHPTLYAVEGVASLAPDDTPLETLLPWIRATETTPELLGISNHIVAVCQR